MGRSLTEQVLIICGRKKAVFDRQKGIAIRPSQGQHPVSTLVFHRAVARHFCEELSFARTGTVKCNCFKTTQLYHMQEVYDFFMS